MRSKIIFAVFAVFASACQTIPDHEVARLEVKDGVATRAIAGRVHNPDVVWWKPVSQMNGHICRSPRDEQKLLEWAKRNCQAK